MMDFIEIIAVISPILFAFCFFKIMIFRERKAKPCAYCGLFFKEKEERIKDKWMVCEPGFHGWIISYYHPKCYNQYRKDKYKKELELDELKYKDNRRRLL